MELWVVATIIISLVALNFLRLPTLAWFIVWPATVYCLIRYGISVHVPSSVLSLYLGLSVVGTLTYVIADNDRFSAVRKQLHTFIVEPRFNILLWIVVILIPSSIAAKIYLDQTKEVRAPSFGRTVHPQPPLNISFKGKQIDLVTGKNPFRELEGKEPEKFLEHVTKGRQVYYENCVFCHGDNLAGDGIFAHGLDPVPANLNSETTIPMLQESYLFWRIAKGGPGLPDESGPWSSSMPAWEKFLEEEDIWNVILFLYDHTGFHPRAQEEGH